MNEKRIADLEHEIHERILDSQYADSWEQSVQIGEDIQRLKKELEKLTVEDVANEK